MIHKTNIYRCTGRAHGRVQAKFYVTAGNAAQARDTAAKVASHLGMTSRVTFNPLDCVTTRSVPRTDVLWGESS